LLQIDAWHDLQFVVQSLAFTADAVCCDLDGVAQQRSQIAEMPLTDPAQAHEQATPNGLARLGWTALRGLVRLRLLHYAALRVRSRS